MVRSPRGRLVLTTDLLAEGVDFLPDADLGSVGWKALAASLSDVAAMGGRPLWALATLALAPATALADGRTIMTGMLALARRHRVTVVGGDLSRSPHGTIVSVALVGSAPRPVLRSGARPGDLLGVTGPLGLAAIGLDLLRRGARLRGARGLARRLLLAQVRPNPDPLAGMRLAPHASAMIDVSDGLSTDLHHLCRESRVGAVVQERLLPLAPAGAGTPGRRLEAALSGGEDFCLLCAYPPGRRRRVEALGVTTVGEATASRRVLLERAGGRREPLPPTGHAHF